MEVREVETAFGGEILNREAGGKTLRATGLLQ